MSSTTVHVSNIHPSTTRSELINFFSFCGKITSDSLTPSSGVENAPLSATITFERESAAKTAVLLDGTPLKDSPLSVQPAQNIDEIAGSHSTQSRDISPNGDIPQEKKPRSAIFAEYLASGYVLGDAVLERGIELDKKHGLTAKFASYLTSALHAVDSKTHALDTAKSMDNQYGLTEKALTAKKSLATYFEKALDTGTGIKLRQFYTTSEKQAMDIHNEAKRLAELKGQKKAHGEGKGDSTLDGRPFAETDTTTCACGGNSEICGCDIGKCVCQGCDKRGMSAKKETDTTTCACRGDAANCVCEPGKCACRGCDKLGMSSKKEAYPTTCACGGDAASCGCEPGNCACQGCDKQQMFPKEEAGSKVGATL